MSRAPVLAAVLAVALAVGACSDDADRLPTSETQALLTSGGPACSPTDLRKAAEALFGKRSPQAAIASQFKPSTANTPTVTPHAFALFAAIAGARDAAGAGWTAANTDAAANLSVHVTACADLVFTEPDLPGEGSALLNAFTAALGAGGTYGVRGGTYGTAAVLSDDEQAGFQPPVLAAATLVLGHPLPNLPLGNEAYGGASYDWFLLQDRDHAGLDADATVALCTPELVDQALRLLHLPAAAGGNIIPYVAAADAPPLACGSGAVRLGRSADLGSRLLGMLERALTPQPLHATAVAFGPVSGLLGSFSPVEVVNPGTILLDFVVAPTAAEVNTPTPMTVRITGAGETPWEGVLVRLSAMANNGQPLTICPDTATTNASGIADFPNFRISKPGGLIIVASTTEPNTDLDVTAYSQAADSTDRFNVTPATTGNTIPCP